MLYLSKQLTAKTKLSKFTGEHNPQTSHLASHVIMVKTKPVDTDEGVQNHLSIPMFISSSEGEDTTLKAKPAKTKYFPSSLKNLDILNRASKKKIAIS